ncbi:MAG: hypothetical protein WC735_02340 [Candidatus Paceibacterota bacterium]|jgi:hypothetical protein
MNKQNILISFLVIVILAMAGAWYFSDKKVDVEEIKNTSEVKNFNTITIGNGPIEFDLPQGYGVYASGGYEGGYEFRVSVGKILRDGYLSEVAPTIYIRDFVPQNNTNIKVLKPSEYVDFILTGTNSGYLEPKLINLFGNKAVETTSDADGNPFLVGYLRGDQLPEIFRGKEYSVTINGGTYGSGKEFDQELFDTIVSSLRIKSN